VVGRQQARLDSSPSLSVNPGQNTGTIPGTISERMRRKPATSDTVCVPAAAFPAFVRNRRTRSGEVMAPAGEKELSRGREGDPRRPYPRMPAPTARRCVTGTALPRTATGMPQPSRKHAFPVSPSAWRNPPEPFAPAI
jgi:hypothetical protein